MRKKKWMSCMALLMAGTLTLQSVNWTGLNVFADDAADLNGTLAYFVDCGDYNVETLPDGESWGLYNSVTEQVYGEDPKTKKKWGVVDTMSDPLTNGTHPNHTKAVYTDWTWPFEHSESEELDKLESNRYTKNQYEAYEGKIPNLSYDKLRNLNYKFELPNGDYTVDLYFADPWGCSKNPKVSMEGETVIDAAAVTVEETAKVTVADGELDLNITSDDLCINLAYIRIWIGDKPASDDKPDIDDDVEYIDGISSYSLGDVEVTDPYLVNAEEKDIAYLLSLDSDRLLAGFRETAGLDMKGAQRYDGWENSLIGGHTMGHYLTAISQAVAMLPEGDENRVKLIEKLNYIITGLVECQNAINTGFIFGSTILDKNNIYKQFDNVEANKANIFDDAWVPWYTMHKILSGLIDAYKYAGNEEALTVAENLGDWIWNRVSEWDTRTQNIVLGIEYGGMNDCLYELYAVSEREDKENYAKAAHKFDEENLFKSVNGGGANVLNNKHANTTIPKFLGALNGYITASEAAIEGVDTSQYLEYAESFFDMVVDRHTYITGDNSEWEHFGVDNILDKERTRCNCETCNAYNMLKLAKALYMITGKAKYLNFYENTFYNTILSSQNPDTGMTTYFQPMKSGYFKVYGTETESFWCCTGSGMENFTKLGNAIYYYDNDMVIVSQYLSSVLTDSRKNLKITQNADIPASDTVTFTVNKIDNSKEMTSKIAFRLPDWLAGEAVITVNGNTADVTKESGYAIVSGLNDNDVITVTLPMAIKAYNLADGPSVYAFKYGPIVLSAKLGKANMTTATEGVQVTVPAANIIGEQYISDGSETISVLEGSVEDFMANINQNLLKADKELEWTLENTDANLTFVPHYSQHTERYGIYFNYISNADALNVIKYIAEKASSRFQNALLDTKQPGYAQYEEGMTEINSIGATNDGTYRYAQAGGYFTYPMKAVKGEDNYLQAYFRKEDNGKTIKISIGNTVVYNETLAYQGDEEEYEVRIKISKDVIEQAAGDSNIVDVKIESADDRDSARLCSFLYMTRAYSSDTSLSLVASKGIVTKDGNVFTINEESDVTTLDLTTKLASEYGYIKIDDIVVRETVPYTVDLGRNNFVTLTITVFAEDHETSTDYTVNIIRDADLSNRQDADKNLAYFVNCGDYDVTTLSEGDLFGLYNGVTDQVYGMDPVTGYTWGIVDTVSNPLVNGGENNTVMTNTAFTDWTWPFETDTSVTDASPKTATNRYTKNQYEAYEHMIPISYDKLRNLNYSFGLPNGEYTIELYFTDPWNCSKNPAVSAEGQVVLKDAAVNKIVTVQAEVTDGQLDLNFTTDDKAINLAYIKIYMPDAEKPANPENPENPPIKEPDTEGENHPSAEPGEDKVIDDQINTGDTRNTNIYVVLLCVSFTVMAVAVLSKKKKEIR